VYKIISDNKVIDVVKHSKFVRFLPFGHIALTDKTSAQGIVGSDNETVYSFITGQGFPVVSIEKISLDELRRLQSLLSSGREIYADETLLANTKRAKISALSDICKSKITAGFTIMLSDGHNHRFNLTPEDQLNLIHIESQLATGELNFVYHASNEPVKVFGKSDMAKIVKAFRKHVLYHTTYFNVAKQYINTLTDIEKVNLFNYGADVSVLTRNPALKQILIDGGA
jgi:hypothetical protein